MKNILNLGCGKGQNIPHISHRGKLYCVDIDPTNIAIAKSRFSEHEYICEMAENIQFPDNFFDEIYCFDVLEHVSDLDKVMDNIYRSLKANGLLYIEVPYDHSEKMLLKVNPDYFRQIGHQRIFASDSLREAFEKYHFTVENITRSRGIVNLYLWLIFKANISLDDQMGSVKDRKKMLLERCIFACCIWFDKNLFNTFLKYIPIWIATMPIGYIISWIYPKTIALTLRPNK